MENDIEKRLEEIGGPCCAHCTVKLGPVRHENGTFSDRWKCVMCGAEFCHIQTVRELKRELDKLAEYTSILAAKPTLENVSTKEAIRSEFMLQLIETNKQAEAENAALKQQVEALKEREKNLVKQRDDARSSAGFICPYDHVAPVQSDLEENKKVEPIGERLRGELEQWIQNNGIVGVMLDTSKHCVRIDSAHLPPEITPVLTRWGSIYVLAENGVPLSAPAKEIDEKH